MQLSMILRDYNYIFNNDEVTSNQVQNTITIVKKQLETVMELIIFKFLMLEDGQLKITYYSDADDF